MRLRISTNARRELKKIITYIAADKPVAAMNWRNGFYDKCKLLKNAPEIGTMRDDIRQGMRVLHYGNYLIFYRIYENIVDVIHVFHGAQEWQNLI